jgi:SAM-dependent methyltransferase
MDDASFIRYLSSKKSVDDRSLNSRVWEGLLSRVKRHPRVLEIGGGIGTMIQRVAEEGRLSPASWTMIDAQPALVETARTRVGRDAPFPAELVVSELDAFLRGNGGKGAGPFDLVVANAFLDLVDTRTTLPRLLPLVERGGLFYFSINFDGLTSLEPEIDRAVDELIIDTYHRTMDERMTGGVPSGDSRCGRHLLTLLPQSGYEILEAGASDWIVHPAGSGYQADEAYFLGCILTFFEESLAGRPEIAANDLSDWLSLRRAQLARGELVFMAHQVDILAARPKG